MGDHVQLIRKIGEGSTGAVYYGSCVKAKRKVAVKVVRKDESTSKGRRTVERARAEAHIMSRELSHRHVCKCYGIVENPDHVFLLLQYAKGGDLLDRINRQGAFSEREARRVLQQLVLAVAYMHKKGYVHRDIKVRPPSRKDASFSSSANSRPSSSSSSSSRAARERVPGRVQQRAVG